MSVSIQRICSQPSPATCGLLQMLIRSSKCRNSLRTLPANKPIEAATNASKAHACKRHAPAARRLEACGLGSHEMSITRISSVFAVRPLNKGESVAAGNRRGSVGAGDLMRHFYAVLLFFPFVAVAQLPIPLTPDWLKQSGPSVDVLHSTHVTLM